MQVVVDERVRSQANGVVERAFAAPGCSTWARAALSVWQSVEVQIVSEPLVIV